MGAPSNKYGYIRPARGTRACLIFDRDFAKASDDAARKLQAFPIALIAHALRARFA